MKSARDDLHRVGRLLDQGREALRRGDLAEVERLTPSLEKALDRLEAMVPPTPDRELGQAAEDVMTRARRNRSLIEASLAGLRDAQALLARARLPRRHETYGRDGRREPMSDSGKQLERRA